MRRRPTPAGELDAAALNGILTLYSAHDLFDRVANDAVSRRQADRAQQERELAKIDADIAKADQVIERYLLAFKAGTAVEAVADGVALVLKRQRRTSTTPD